MDRGKGHREIQNRRIQNAQNSCHIPGKQKLDRIPDIPVHIPAVGHRLNQGRKIIICQDHGRRILGNLGSHQPHCHADIGFF